MQSISKENTVKDSGPWTAHQHEIFLSGKNLVYLGLERYGKNWKKIGELIPNRSHAQIRSHAQKYFYKLNRKF